MFGKNKKANQEVEVKETKKTGFRAACSNFRNNVCDELDKVSARDGKMFGVGTVVGVVGTGAVAYGLKKRAERAANAAECAAADDAVEFTERRTR